MRGPPTRQTRHLHLKIREEANKKIAEKVKKQRRLKETNLNQMIKMREVHLRAVKKAPSSNRKMALQAATD